jgi:two-component system, OmpR family, KDP operon response regulator KdpE
MSVDQILVVDDEPQMRRVLRAVLIAHGYRVVEAASGQQALERLKGRCCDLVLLDLNLPGMNGLEVCRTIRAISEVLVIVVSIRDSEEDRLAARAAGANDYITKPYGIEELLSRIDTLSK